MKILIAEDSSLTRHVLTNLLKQNGCEVHTVENGEQALLKLLNEPFDLVITDYRMPQMGGAELTAAIRSLLGDRIKIVGMTASEDCRHLFEEAGVDSFFHKPIDQQSLSRVIQQFEKEVPCPPTTAP